MRSLLARVAPRCVREAGESKWRRLAETEALAGQLVGVRELP